MLFGTKKKLTIPSADEALSGRDVPIDVPETHHVLGTPMKPPFPDSMDSLVVGMGCFWGAERLYWKLGGVHSTHVGYAGGHTPNPTYREVCTGRTGHTEVVRIIFDPDIVPLSLLLQTFWENHDPTQGMRQGNDVGTQYRSAIYTASDDQHQIALKSRDAYQQALQEAGHGDITTEITDHQPFFYAEANHQQYLAKNPRGYCGIGGVGVGCPTGFDVSET